MINKTHFEVRMLGGFMSCTMNMDATYCIQKQSK